MIRIQHSLLLLIVHWQSCYSSCVLFILSVEVIPCDLLMVGVGVVVFRWERWGSLEYVSVDFGIVLFVCLDIQNDFNWSLWGLKSSSC